MTCRVMGPMDAQLNECGTMLDWMRASDRMHELADERLFWLLKYRTRAWFEEVEAFLFSADGFLHSAADVQHNDANLNERISRVNSSLVLCS